MAAGLVSEFRAPEGDYRECRKLVARFMDLSRHRGVMPASLRAHTVALSVHTCPEGGGSDRMSTHLLMSYHRDLAWHRDFDPIPCDTLTHAQSGFVFTCHDINSMRRAEPALEAIVGFSTGELVFRNFLSKKTLSFNEDGILSKQPVSAVRWIPGEDLFLCGFADGSLFILSPERDRIVASPFLDTARKSTTASPGAFSCVRNKTGVGNPVAMWVLGDDAGAIHDISFSPDGAMAAVVCASGTLFVVDVKQEKLVFSASSYFGALHCVAWSPDGQYIVTGGQDDLVTIWSLHERDIVARGQGHNSWVSAVAFDAYFKGDDMCYRIGSVGQDARLCLWDFSAAALRQPRRSSIAHMSPSIQVRRHKKSSKEGSPVHVPARSRCEVATLTPTVSVVLDKEPLTALVFREDFLITACGAGMARLWSRPEMGTLL